MRRNFARILPTCPGKAALHVSSDVIFFNSKHAGRHFCSYFQGVCEGCQRFFPDFVGCCPDFMGFCPDFIELCPIFCQIKTFGGAVAPPASYTSGKCWRRLQVIDVVTNLSAQLSKKTLSTGLPGWQFHGQFRKIWPFLKCVGHEKTHLAIL